MNIQVLEQKSEEMKAFDKHEWKAYDQEHFGHVIVWDTKTYFLKAEDETGILGTLEVKVEGGVGKINTLLVGKGNQRKGVGKALMEKAEEITKQQNGHKLFLMTGKGWEAIKFYETMGFEKTAEVNNHYFNTDFIELTKFI
ncbi:MAG: GNAT family N-acetyltransferase [Candidatus Levybacteria bacterium]|nr:GNAT family N-acetyltransferase [Candidatus Levybacteria bacterium]